MRAVQLIDRARRHDGFAIPAAVFVIVVLTLVAIAGLYVAQSNATANTGIRLSLRALYAADAGSNQVIGTWSSSRYRLLNPGDSVTTEWRTLPDGSQYRTTVLRVDDGQPDGAPLYRLQTMGRPGNAGTAQRVIVTMVKVDVGISTCCDAAMKTQGALNVMGVGAGVKVSGVDTPPVTWSGICEPDRSDIPGVLMQDLGGLSVTGHPVFEGTPPLYQDPLIDDDDFTQFGDLSYEDLARIADKHFDGSRLFDTLLPETEADGGCAESVPTNWGDPLDPAGACWEYLPIVHVAGDLKLTGAGIGQGVLLIDGDLEVTGEFEYYGVIIVQGKADFRGTTDLNGGLLVRSGISTSELSYLRGGTTLQYSSCSTARALARANVPRLLAGRHWFEALN
jgi:hypothetical protein